MGFRTALTTLIGAVGIMGALATVEAYVDAHPSAPAHTGDPNPDPTPTPTDPFGNPIPDPGPDPTPSPEPQPGSGGSGTGGGDSGGSGGGGYVCTTQSPSGEAFTLYYKELAEHIVEDHTTGAAAGQSLWNEDRWYPEGDGGDVDPADTLGNRLCDALGGQPLAVRESTNFPGNREFLVESSDGPAGTYGATGEPTNYFTVVVRPDGSVATAFPDLLWFS